MLFYEDLVGPRTAGVASYYAGAQKTVAAAPVTGGPKIEMRPEASVESSERITIAVTYRKLLEVTHFHLFTVPVFLLIIAHLFMLTGLSSTAKLVWIALGWLSSLLHLGAPWLIRYGGAGWSFSYAASGAVMGVSLAVVNPCSTP